MSAKGWSRKFDEPSRERRREPSTDDGEAMFDLAEFGRLLSSGKPEDFKMIARAMTQPDRTFAVPPLSRFRHIHRPNASPVGHQLPWRRTPGK